MRKTIFLSWFAVLVLSFVLVACSSPSSAPPAPAATTAPAAPAATTAPAAPAAGDPAAGKQVWASLPCQGCHGVNAEGGSGPKLAGTTRSYDRVLAQVRRGGGPMPAFPADQVSDQDVQNIYAWLKTLQ
jgi:mono/diheme cytochrome c family protein